MTTRFNLILTGHVLTGHTHASVGQALARVMQISADRAGRLLAGRETVIKRGLLERQLPKYLEAMRAAGAEARVVPEWSAAETVVVEPFATLAPYPAESPGAPDEAPSAAAPTARQPLEAAEVAAEVAIAAPVASPGTNAEPAAKGAGSAPAGLALMVEETMECPACGAVQPKRTLCRECGADMPRVLAARGEAAREARDESTSGAAAVSSRAQGSPYAAPRSSVDEIAAAGDFATPHPLGLSLSGRVGRLRYLAYAFPAYVPAVVGGIVAGIMGGVGRPGMGLLVPMVLGAIATVWLALRIMVLRLHDLNRTGKWVFLTVIVPVVAAVSQSPTLLVAFVVLVVVASLLLVFLPGSAGSNDYGAPPGPNTFWTIIGAVLMILLTIVGFVSDTGTGLSGFGSSGEELSDEEMQQLQDFQRQLEEMQRRPSGG